MLIRGHAVFGIKACPVAKYERQMTAVAQPQPLLTMKPKVPL
jgi:hypothetical protein